MFPLFFSSTYKNLSSRLFAPSKQPCACVMSVRPPLQSGSRVLNARKCASLPLFVGYDGYCRPCLGITTSDVLARAALPTTWPVLLWRHYQCVDPLCVVARVFVVFPEVGGFRAKGPANERRTDRGATHLPTHSARTHATTSHARNATPAFFKTPSDIPPLPGHAPSLGFFRPFFCFLKAAFARTNLTPHPKTL